MLWKELKKQFKFLDGVIIITLIILSFVPYIVFAISQPSQEEIDRNAPVAFISIDGEVVDRFILSEQTKHQEKTYHPHKGQYNIVEIKQNKIRVKEDNSPDQIAVMTGWISKPGQMSICLPHRLIIEIKGIPDEEDDDIIMTY